MKNSVASLPRALVSLGLACLTAAVASAQAAPRASEDRGERTAEGIEWNRRTAEHLINRAGFGARPVEIELAVRMGAEAFVDRLLAGPESPAAETARFYPERLAGRDGGRAEMRDRMELNDLSMEDDSPEMQAAINELRRQDQVQLLDYTTTWIGDMVAGEDPLRDRMTLFWHGFFTSSMEDVKSSFNLIQQHQFLRAHALGSFEELLRGIARDPAMLEYLDNRSNKKESPNENFARELMELFSLGEGHFTEDDVIEAARAFTGWTDRAGEFRLSRGQHDKGIKHVLGHQGRYDGDNVIDILLEQEACPRWVAGRLLAYFEGAEPDEARLSEYAGVLRDAEYDLSTFLRRLFLDPGFYREEIVGRRIASPIDYLVGSVRRLDTPLPPLLVYLGARITGEHLFHPPNVKGWSGAEAWITTSTLMMRANLAGVMLGQVPLEEVLQPDAELYDADEAMGMASGGGMAGDEGVDLDGDMGGDGGSRRPAQGQATLGSGMRQMVRVLGAWRPHVSLSARLRVAGARADAEVVDWLLHELLPVEPTSETRSWLLAHLDDERRARGIDAEVLTDAGHAAERLVRELAHLVLSQPEAQLN